MPHTIRLRTDVFTKAARLAGFRSAYALAKAMDVNRSPSHGCSAAHPTPVRPSSVAL